MDPMISPSPSSAADLAAVDEIVARLHELPGAMLPILHEIKRRFGYIPHDAVARIAAGLNLSRAEVHGVVSFYHDFRTEPPGRHVIRVCRAESCQAMGAVALEEHVIRTIGASFGQTSADGEFTLEPVYCFGNCACSPAIMFDDTLIGRASAAAFDAALASNRKQS